VAAGHARPGAGRQRATSARVQVAAISRPSSVSVSDGQPKSVRSSSRVVPGCGSENSHVPPARKASPSRQVLPGAGMSWVTVLMSVSAPPPG
jgi:hypothetical protein